MKIIKYLQISVTATLLTGITCCKKNWLDVKADKLQVVPSTYKDFQSMLDYNAYINDNGAAELAELASDGHYSTEDIWTGATDLARNTYTWSHTKPYTEQFLGPWTLCYKSIFICNVVIDALKKKTVANGKDQQSWNDIYGQALYHRANEFYNVASVWSPIYQPNSSNNGLGIPLRLESDIALPSIRYSVQKTYDQIIADLLESKDLLPMTSTYKTRPSRPAVFALLARIYLSMQEYDKAGLYADSSLNLYNSLLDYNSVDTSATYIGDFNTNPEVILHVATYTDGINNMLTTNCFIDSSFFDMYDANDLRSKIYFQKNSDGSISYKGNYNSSTSLLFCGLSTDEVYLIRAECFARKGNTSAAISDLNTLLQKRWKSGTFTPFSASNAADALDKILLERRKELLFRGLRWTDLKRLNLEDRFKITITRHIGGGTYSLQPNGYQYVLPIPDDIIKMSGMQQNVGW